MKPGDGAAIDRDAPTRCEPPGHSSPAHYLSEPFPCALDLFVLRRVLAFHRAEATERAALCASPLSENHVTVMLSFAERMAHVAVRKRQTRLVQVGLVALAIVGRQPLRIAREKHIHEFERSYLTELLRAHNNNVSAAARAADVNRAYLHRLLARHRLR